MKAWEGETNRMRTEPENNRDDRYIQNRRTENQLSKKPGRTVERRRGRKKWPMKVESTEKRGI